MPRTPRVCGTAQRARTVVGGCRKEAVVLGEGGDFSRRVLRTQGLLPHPCFLYLFFPQKWACVYARNKAGDAGQGRGRCLLLVVPSVDGRLCERRRRRNARDRRWRRAPSRERLSKTARAYTCFSRTEYGTITCWPARASIEHHHAPDSGDQSPQIFETRASGSRTAQHNTALARQTRTLGVDRAHTRYCPCPRDGAAAGRSPARRRR